MSTRAGLPRVGIGIITCNRKEFFEKCFTSVIKAREELIDNINLTVVVVNDGDLYDVDVQNYPVIQHEKNMGVAKTKNDALTFLFNSDCDYMFLIEDDIIIKDSKVFEKYIELHKISGIDHFNYGYHGPANKKNGQPNPRLMINYGDKAKIALNLHCVGAFSFYSKQCLKAIGLLDEAFINAWEHVEHTYNLIKAGYHPPFWWFADLADSYEYLDELACSENNSTIRSRTDWQQNIQNGLQHFYSKHATTPTQIYDVTKDVAIQYLKKHMELAKTDERFK